MSSPEFAFALAVALNQLDSDLQFMTIGQAARLCDESRSD